MITCKNIIEKITPIQFIGDENSTIENIAQLNPPFSNQLLYWCSDKNKVLLEKVDTGTVIISNETFSSLNRNKIKFNCIIVENPRKYFMDVVKNFFASSFKLGFVSPTASIHPSVIFDKEKVYIGHNVVLEEDVILGDDVIIMHNTVLLNNTKVGNQVRIGSNCTVGGVGFGYEKNESGNYELIPHIGNVEILDNVEIGNNVAIDRAVMGSTIIGKNVKIDNLVHIAHGVTIGENSLIIANAMIAGSVSIGKNVWVAPSSSIMQKVKIEDDALIGMSSNVLKNVDEKSVVAGNPAKKIK